MSPWAEEPAHRNPWVRYVGFSDVRGSLGCMHWCCNNGAGPQARGAAAAAASGEQAHLPGLRRSTRRAAPPSHRAPS